MIDLVCCLEEPSAKEMLQAIFKKELHENVTTQFIVFEGKQDLRKGLEKKMKGWNKPNSFFLVMCDQDQDDCVALKKSLTEKVNNSGKSEKTLIRIACHELESFYLGDLNAVALGLNIKGLAKQQNKSKFRTPDGLNNAAQELKKITKGKYQKIQGSRNIAPFLRLDGTNTSHSFNVLINGINKLTNNNHIAT